MSNENKCIASALQYTVNILLIATVRRDRIGSYYLKALKQIGCRVLTLSQAGDFWIDGAFGWEEIEPWLRHFDFRPDFVLMIEGSEGIGFNMQLKGKTPVVSAFYSIDTARQYFAHAELGRYFDYIFITQPDYLELFRQRGGKKVSWLPMCCDPEVQMPMSIPSFYDIVFVGNVYRPLYNERTRLLKQLGADFKLLFKQDVYWDDMASTHAKGKMVFNHSSFGACNFRTFEALACRKLVLTNRVENGLQTLFKDGCHLVLYDDYSSLRDFVRYYLKHEDDRERIAFDGYQEVVEKHTFVHRMQQLLHTVGF